MTIKRKMSASNRVSKKTKTITIKKYKQTYMIYCRVSTTEQSLQSQEHSCMQFCNEKGFDVTKIIKESCSARKINSQHELRKLINENTDITIVVNSVDRFSRNVNECLKLFSIMKKNRINIISVTDQIDLNTAYGMHAFRTRVSTAQLESDTISERVRRTINYKRELGLELSSRVAYGYKVVDGKKEIDLKEQAVIRFIGGFLLNKETKVTSEYFSTELYKLLDLYGKPDDYYVPVLFEENEIEVQSVRMTANMIADVLNDYDLLRRNKYWTQNSIYNLTYSLKNLSMDFTL